MGSDQSHFNVSVGSDGQSHKTVSTNHNLFEEKGEPKRYRTEVLPFSLPLVQTGSQVTVSVAVKHYVYLLLQNGIVYRSTEARLFLTVSPL